MKNNISLVINGKKVTEHAIKEVIEPFMKEHSYFVW